jgi:nucleoside-diphosphate-sugar epimerase
MMAMKNNRTVLVTGPSGFIGSHLTNKLAVSGWDTHIIIRPNSDLTPLTEVLSDITIHCHDGSTENMNEIMRKAKPDIVFHLASLFLASHTAQDIEPMIRSNVIFGSQLVEAMVSNNINHLINTGTSWQHFENQTYSPVCLYAATKQAFEAILTYYVENSPLKVTTLKLFDTYGPNDQRPKLIPLLQKTKLEQKKLFMSKGEQLIDIVYIDDVIDAFIIAAERHFNGQCAKIEDFAVSSENPIRLKELVKIYEHIIGKTLPIEWGIRPYRNREVMVPWNNGTRLINWSPKYDLNAGIRKIEFEE